MTPSVSVVPDVPAGSSASGLVADVHVPQSAALAPEGLSESAVRDIEVTLPEGVAVNPAGVHAEPVDGLILGHQISATSSDSWRSTASERSHIHFQFSVVLVIAFE